ncbi:MAG: transposase [Candidatus Marinimicrobia bacterium]|nr:transposase [Candidatus Neomarinimicrobiota bacterium]
MYLSQATRQHKPIKKKQDSRDEIVELIGDKTKLKYPETLRIVGYTDPETGKYYEYMTNNLKLAAVTIAGIYKSRWDIETFFRWIKQNLKIKSFLGTSKNAVLTQVWVAICYYLLLTYINSQIKYAHSITELGRMIKEVLMERTNLIDILSVNAKTIKKDKEPVPQLALF